MRTHSPRIRTLLPLLLLGALGTGCAISKKVISATGPGLSMFQSPLVLRTGARNSRMKKDEAAGLEAVRKLAPNPAADSRIQAMNSHIPDERRADYPFDDHKDLILPGDRPLFMVCISGGGARAARFAAHVMAAVEEEYETRTAGAADTIPMLDCIDGFSTVSGGSIYASFVGTVNRSIDIRVRKGEAYLNALEGKGGGAGRETDLEQKLKRLEKHRKKVIDRIAGIRDERSACFRTVRESKRVRKGTRDLGFRSGLAYLNPLHLFYLPLMTMFTDREYLDVVSWTLDNTYPRAPDEKSIVLRWHRAFPVLLPGLDLGELPQKPRFFFNATCQANAQPFVLTQRAIHLPAPPEAQANGPAGGPRGGHRKASSVDFSAGSDVACDVPLSEALTLEDIGSHPRQISLANAVIASSAFPIIFDPFVLELYDVGRTWFSSWQSKYEVPLIDGGIFDNSGLTTAVRFMEYIARMGIRENSPSPDRRKLVLLYINAENDILKAQKSFGAPIGIPVDGQIPVRGLFKGPKSLDTIHFANKRRAEILARDRFDRLPELGVAAETVYLKVDLLDVEPDPATPDPDKEKLFRDVQKIPTDFVISSKHDKLLRKAANTLLDTSPPGQGADSTLLQQICDQLADMARQRQR